MKIAERLRGRRREAGRGSLTLDRAKARDAFRQFRLPDPHMYVAQLVRVGAIVGATSVDFRVGTTQTICRIDKQIDATYLNDLWGVGLGDRGDDDAAKAVHALALAIASAQALQPDHIAIESAGVRVVVTEDDEVVGGAPVHNYPGTVVQVVEKLRLGHVFEWVRAINGLHAEESRLRTLCACAGFAVRVNEKPIAANPAMASPETWTASGDSRVWLSFDSLTYAWGVRGPRTNHDYGVKPICVITRDAVEIARVEHPVGCRPALGVVESSGIATDLSGLAPHDGEAVDAVVHNDFVPVYHRWLAVEVRSWSAREQLQVLVHTLRFVEETPQLQGRAQAATRELLRTLYDEPIFELATEQSADICLKDAIVDGVLRTSSQRHDGEVCGAPIVACEPTRVAITQRDDIVRAQADALAALGRVGGVELVDASSVVQTARVRESNRAAWEARAHHEPLPAVCEHIVARAAARVRLFIVSAAPFDGARRTPNTFICSDGKVVRTAQDDSSLGIEIDGSLSLGPSYADVVRDERFDEIVVAAMQGVIPLYQALAHQIGAKATVSTADRNATALLDELVSRLVAGSFGHAFLSRLGYDPLSAERLLTAHHGDIGFLAEPLPRDAITSRLGPIAAVRSYLCAHGEPRSLAEAVAAPQLSVVERINAGPPQTHWSSRVRRLRAEYGSEPLRDVMILSPAQRELLEALRGPLPQAEEAVARAAALRRFMDQPQHEPAIQSNPGYALTWRISGGTCDLWLLSEEPGSELTIEMVYADRHIDTLRLPTVAGRFYAVIRSEALTPEPTYDAVLSDATAQALVESVEAACFLVLDEWWQGEHREPPSSGFASLLFRTVGLLLAHDDPQRRCILVQQEGALVLRSRDELASRAPRDGACVAFSRFDVCNPDALAHPDTPVVLVSGPSSQLSGLFSSDVRLVDASPESVSTPAAYHAFVQRPRWSDVPLGRIIAAGVHEGLTFRIAQGPYQTRSANVVTVLWEERALEQIEIPLPFGNFRTVVAGPQIAPDAGYQHVGKGRGQIGDLAVVAAATAVRKLCEAPPRDFAPTLRHWIAASTTADLPPQLELLEVMKSALASSFAPSATQELAPRVEDATEPEFGADREDVERGANPPFLQEIVDCLLAARGDRRQLIADDILSGVSWGDCERVCEVDAHGIRIQQKHRLVQLAVSDGLAMQALVSVLATAINAYYRSISDRDDVQIQVELLRMTRADHREAP